MSRLSIALFLLFALFSIETAARVTVTETVTVAKETVYLRPTALGQHKVHVATSRHSSQHPTRRPRTRTSDHRTSTRSTSTSTTESTSSLGFTKTWSGTYAPYTPTSTHANSGGGAYDAESGKGNSSVSTGAIVAIGVVVGLVVVFGITTTVLFYLAKKRQWELRKKMKHMSKRISKRFTGGAAPARRMSRSNRQAMHRIPSPPGRKVRDVEKGEIRKVQIGETREAAPIPRFDPPPTKEVKKPKPIYPPSWYGRPGHR